MIEGTSGEVSVRTLRAVLVGKRTTRTTQRNEYHHVIAAQRIFASANPELYLNATLLRAIAKHYPIDTVLGWKLHWRKRTVVNFTGPDGETFSLFPVRR